MAPSNTCSPVLRDGHINLIGCALVSGISDHWSYETTDDVLWVDGTPEEFEQDSPSPFVSPGTPPYYIMHWVYYPSGGLTTRCPPFLGWSCLSEGEWGPMDEGGWGSMEDGCVYCTQVPVSVHIPYVGGKDDIGLVIEDIDSALVERSTYYYVPSGPGLIIVPEPGVQPIVSHWTYVGGQDGLMIVPDAIAIYSHRVYTVGATIADVLILDGSGADLNVHWIYIPVTQEIIATAPLHLGGSAIVDSDQFSYTPGTGVGDVLILNGQSEVEVIHWIYYGGEDGGITIEIPPGALYLVNYVYIPTDEDPLVLIDPGAIVDNTHFVYIPDIYDVLGHLIIGGSSVVISSDKDITYDPGTNPSDRLVLSGLPMLNVGYVYIVEPPPQGQPSLILDGTVNIVASNWIYRAYDSPSDILVFNGMGDISLNLIYIPTQEIEIGGSSTAFVVTKWIYIPESSMSDVLLLDGYSGVISSAYQYTPGVTPSDSLILNGELMPFIDYYINHYHYIPSPMDRLLLDGRTHVISSAWQYVGGQDGGLYIIPDAGWTHYYWIQTRNYLWIPEGGLILNGTALLPQTDYTYVPDTTPDDRLILDGIGAEAIITHRIYIPDGSLVLNGSSPATTEINLYYTPGTGPDDRLIINSYTTWYGNASYYIPRDGLWIQCHNTFLVSLHLSYVPDVSPDDILILNGQGADYIQAPLPPPPEPPEPLIRRYTPIDVILPTSQKRREEEYSYAVFRFGMEEPIIPLLYETRIEATIIQQNLEKEMAMPNLNESVLSVRKIVTYHDEIVKVI